MKSMFLIQK